MTRAKIWIVSILLLLGLAVGGAWMYLNQHLGNDVAKARELYDKHLEALKKREWIRPSAEGEELEDGKAADFYKKAWESCELAEEYPDDIRDSVTAATAAMVPLKHRPESVELAEVGQDISPVCRKAGVTSPDDPVSAQLTDDACQLILDCDASLDLIEKGARQRDARSPYFAFDDWAAEDKTNFRNLMPHLIMGDMLMIRGHLRSKVSGSPVPRYRATLTTMRFGRDLGRGAALLPAFVGAAIERNALNVLSGILEQPLSEEQRNDVLLGLQNHARNPVDIEAVFQAEFLYSVGPILVGAGEDVEVPAASLELGQTDGAEQKLFQDALGDLADYWEEIFVIQPRPLPHRLRRYEELEKEMSENLNPLSNLIPQYGKYDLQLSLLDAQTRLLMLAFAIRGLAERAGNERLTMDMELITKHAWPGADALIDPLTDREYSIDDKLILHSRARDGDGLQGLLEDNDKSHLEVDVSTWME